MRPFIYLYNGGGEALDLGEIAGYLGERLKNLKIELREEIASQYLSLSPIERREELRGSLALKLARLKLRNITTRLENKCPLHGEVEYEKRWLDKDTARRKPLGILYDGFGMQAAYFDLLPKTETRINHIHIVFTNQLFATWDENDLRYHARVSVYGFPSIISTTGLVEAPARPREFYLRKSMGISIIDLKQEFSGKFIDYGDPRTTEVIKGYVMQVLFYHLTGHPFCEDRGCRLYNSHWQEEVIQAQLGGDYEFCKRHEEALACLNNS